MQKNLAHKIQVKFKNVRKRSHSPSVQVVRAKRAEKRGDKAKFKLHNMTAYMPAIKNSVAKDETIINKMKEGSEADGMLETFPRRRHEVLGDKNVKAMTLPKLKKRYPRLFCAEEVSVLPTALFINRCHS